MARSASLCLAALLLAAPLTARAQHPNVRVSSPGVTDPEEVTISTNPAEALHLAAGANIDYQYHSFDGGATWSEGQLVSSLGVVGDPVVLYDAEGHLYFTHLAAPLSGYGLDRMVVQRSLDGGVTWNDGASAGLHPPRAQQDKPGLAADLTGSPFHDQVYLAWTEFDEYGSPNPSDSTRILFSRSTDLGLTWSTPVRVSDEGGNCLDGDDTVEGAIPAVGPEGEVYVAWSGPGGIHFDRSLDGGASFGGDLLVTAQPGGWDFQVSGLYRCNGLPTTLCDISGSPYRGYVYVVWSDERAGVADTDVFLARSTDGGQTWGAPVRVNDDQGTTRQFFPAAAVDPTTGIIYVVYYDRRASTDDATEVYLARSYDGGASFQSLLVSDTPFTPTGGFLGDYIGVAVWDREVHPIWTRMDDGNLSVWTASWADPGSVVAVPAPAPAQGVALRGPFPNPVRARARLSVLLTAPGHVTMTIVDVQGRRLATPVDAWLGAGEHRVEWDARDRPAGVYFVSLAAGGVTRTARMVVMD